MKLVDGLPFFAGPRVLGQSPFQAVGLMKRRSVFK